MFKKIVFSVSLVFCLLVGLTTSALADAPDNSEFTIIPFTYPAANCNQYGYDFTINHTWEETDHVLTFYNKDGSVNYIATHAKMRHTFTNTLTGKSISGEATDKGITSGPLTFPSGTMEIRGFFQRIIIPGVGPIFMDGGRKIFSYTWMPDGSIHFDLIFNAGPTSYTENDFSALCAYLAEE
jgi:hypothetical protein